MPGTPPPIVNMNPPGMRRPTLNGLHKPAFEPPGGIPATAPTRKLHPLHSIDWVANQVRMTGQYPDTERMTGRTTILALEFLVRALKNPGEVVQVRDHESATRCHIELVKLIHDMTRLLGLSHLKCNPSRLTIQFERTETPRAPAETFPPPPANPFAGFHPLTTPTPQRGY